MTALATIDPQNLPPAVAARVAARRASGVKPRFNLGGGGASINRIGLKGNRFHMHRDGQLIGTANTLDLNVVILTAQQDVGRLYFEGAYQEGDAAVAPSCWSDDGRVPSAAVKAPKCNRCDLCPMNAKGSGRDGETRACSFVQGLVVEVYGDPAQTPFRIDCKGQTIFGEDMPQSGHWSLRGYGKRLAQMGVDVSEVYTNISFDPRSSTPKLLFKPVGYIQDEAELTRILTRGESDEVKAMLRMAGGAPTADAALPPPAPAPQPMAPQPMAAQPVQQYAPQPMAAQPVQQYAPQPMAPQPMAAPAQEAPAKRPRRTKAETEVARAAAAPAPVAAQAPPAAEPMAQPVPFPQAAQPAPMGAAPVIAPMPSLPQAGGPAGFNDAEFDNLLAGMQ